MTIEVFTKDIFAENEKKNLIKKISHFYPNVKDVRESKIYIVEGPYKKNDFFKMGKDVFCDFISEDFTISSGRKLKDFIAAEMLFKQGITDVLAQSAAEALIAAGFKKPEKINTGKVFYIKGLKEAQAENAVKECFANELIHRVGIR